MPQILPLAGRCPQGGRRGKSAELASSPSVVSSSRHLPRQGEDFGQAASDFPRAVSQYITGVATRLRRVEVIRPPMMAMASGE